MFRDEEGRKDMSLRVFKTGNNRTSLVTDLYWNLRLVKGYSGK